MKSILINHFGGQNRARIIAEIAILAKSYLFYPFYISDLYQIWITNSRSRRLDGVNNINKPVLNAKMPGQQGTQGLYTIGFGGMMSGGKIMNIQLARQVKSLF